MWNESFFGAPQLKRGPLGGTLSLPIIPSPARGTLLACLLALACDNVSCRPSDTVHYRISGRVIDPATRHELAGASVQVVGLGLEATTDNGGHFAFEGNYLKGCYALRLSGQGRTTTYLRFSVSSAGSLGGAYPLQAVGRSPSDSLVLGACRP